MTIFTVGDSEVGGEDTLGGTYSLVPDPVVEPPELPVEPSISIPTTPAEWAFLDDFKHSIVDYNFVVGDGSPEFVLSYIQNPNLRFNLKDNCSVSFDLNQLDPLAANVTELLTDLWIYRDGELIFRGRVGPSQDKLDSNGGYVSFTAIDYRGVLKRRFFYDDNTTFWYDEDVSRIISDCLSMIQGRTGGNYSISEGIGFPDLGVVRREVEFNPGTNFTDSIDSLQESKLRGFDWEIDADLNLNVWAQRGISPADKLIEYNGAMLGLTRDFKTDEFANAVRASGGEIPEPVVLEDANISVDPRGRWELEVSWPDSETQEILDDRVEYLLEQVNVVPEQYSAELVNGFWRGPSHLWLGDEVVMPINFGRLSVSKSVRVHEISISPDGKGGENVKMVLK